MAVDDGTSNACPNCGKPVAAGRTMCESCGYMFVGHSSGTGEKIAAILLLVLAGIPLAIGGSCMFILPGVNALTILMGVGGLLIFGLLVWLMAETFKKPR